MRVPRILFPAVAALLCAPMVHADDGVVEINHAGALAGIGGADTPGYPVEIGSPGSYRLTGNLDPGLGDVTIVMLADDISLDLNGFVVSGAPPAPPATKSDKGPPASGVVLMFGNNQAIGNGTINEVVVIGVHVFGFNARIENLQVIADGGGVGVGIVLEPPIIAGLPKGGGAIYTGTTTVLDGVAVRGGFGENVVTFRNLTIRNSLLSDAYFSTILIPGLMAPKGFGIDGSLLTLRIESSTLEQLAGPPKSKGPIPASAAIDGCTNVEFIDSHFSGIGDPLSGPPGSFMTCSMIDTKGPIGGPIGGTAVHIRDSVFSNGLFGSASFEGSLVIEGSTFNEIVDGLTGVSVPTTVAISGNRFNGSTPNPLFGGLPIKGPEPALVYPFGIENLCNGFSCGLLGPIKSDGAR